MKHILYFCCLSLALFSCSKSLDEGFDEANPNIKEKLVDHITVSTTDKHVYTGSYYFSYDGDNNLTNITNDEGTIFFNYDSESNLTKITGNRDDLLVSDLYQSPYNLFEDGKVKSYDENGNPRTVEVYDAKIVKRHNMLYGEIWYYKEPNPLFFTMKAGGIIDVLNQVNLNIGTVSTPNLINAKAMIPFNLYKSMIFKNMEGETVADVQYISEFDDDKYATETVVNYHNYEGKTTTIIRYYYK